LHAFYFREFHGQVVKRENKRAQLLGKSAQFELPRKFTKVTYNDSISD